MVRKRASSSGSSRPAFGRVDLGDQDLVADDLADDHDPQRPGHQSRRDEADPEDQRAALAYGRRLELDAIACRFCGGETDQADGRVMHDRACPFR